MIIFLILFKVRSTSAYFKIEISGNSSINIRPYFRIIIKREIYDKAGNTKTYSNYCDGLSRYDNYMA